MQAGFGTPFAARSQRIEQRGGFRGYAIIPPTPYSVVLLRRVSLFGLPYLTPGDPLGTLWGPLGHSLGIPGTPWGSLRDPLGILGKSWGPLGTL